MRSLVEKILANMLRVEMGVAFFTMAAMSLAIAADMIGRELFNHGIFGAVKFSVFALIYCAMAGYGIATASGGHLRPAFLDSAAPKSIEDIVVRAGHLASAAISLILVYGGIKMAQFSYSISDTDLTLGIPVWPVQLAIPLGFGLSVIRYLAYALWPDLAPVKGSLPE